jgi:molecular chaperone HscB
VSPNDDVSRRSREAKAEYFAFLGLPRRLNIDMALLEQRFRELSRQYHPDYFYNAPAKERLAALERSSHLNDAYRTLRNPVSRIEYLLGLEGLALTKPGDVSNKVPPSLLEEVFALNEELDEIRELRESGGDARTLGQRLTAARKPIEQKRDAHERELQELSARWDSQQDRATLEALRDRMLERNYINNLLAAIDREAAGLAEGSGLTARGSEPGQGHQP